MSAQTGPAMVIGGWLQWEFSDFLAVAKQLGPRSFHCTPWCPMLARPVLSTLSALQLQKLSVNEKAKPLIKGLALQRIWPHNSREAVARRVRS